MNDQPLTDGQMDTQNVGGYNLFFLGGGGGGGGGIKSLWI